MQRIQFAIAAALAAIAGTAAAQSAQSTDAKPVRALSGNTVRAVSPRADQSLVYGQAGTPFAFTATNAYDTTKVSPEIDNMRVGDAVKKVLETAGKEVEIDKDIPDVRVSLKAKDIRLGTFMDVMSQVAQAGWSIEMRDGKARYRFGKAIKSAGNWFIDPLTTKGYRALVNPPNSDLFRSLNKGQSFVFTDPTTGTSAFRNYLGAETRTTITCPHCKGNVTSIRSAAPAPKCPKCSRTFQSGWDFCPSDGSKRPATVANEWKHCPLCGKEVDFSKETKRSTQIIPTGAVPAIAEVSAPISERPAKR